MSGWPAARSLTRYLPSKRPMRSQLGRRRSAHADEALAPRSLLDRHRNRAGWLIISRYLTGRGANLHLPRTELVALGSQQVLRFKCLANRMKNGARYRKSAMKGGNVSDSVKLSAIIDRMESDSRADYHRSADTESGGAATHSTSVAARQKVKRTLLRQNGIEAR